MSISNCLIGGQAGMPRRRANGAINLVLDVNLNLDWAWIGRYC